MAENRNEVITFKVDRSLLEQLQGIPNRSEFIRSALLRQLGNVCPLCRGSGVLSPAQKRHWEAFARDHRVEECGECHELRLTCDHATSGEEASS
jgi:hypothetical protein